MAQRSLLTLVLIGSGFAAPVAAVALPQASATDGASRAGSNAGSSSLTPTSAPAPRRATRSKRSKAAASHRLPASVTGMGSQAANATGAISNSH